MFRRDAKDQVLCTWSNLQRGTPATCCGGSPIGQRHLRKSGGSYRPDLFLVNRDDNCKKFIYYEFHGYTWTAQGVEALRQLDTRLN